MTEAADHRAPLQRNFGVSLLTLLASGGTLVCCVLPAVMVALGAGAALPGLVTAVPQLVWLSEHKATVFTVAFVLLAISGLQLRHARTLPCPIDARAARACLRLRRASSVMWWIALASTLLGAVFAFVLPRLA